MKKRLAVIKPRDPGAIVADLKRWNPSPMREELAALMHEIWAGWTNHMLQHHANISFRRGWSRQMGTPYDELSEKEKDSDRKEADKVLALIEKYVDEVDYVP